MAFWEFVTLGVFGALIHKGIKAASESAEEERRRKNTPCYFTDGITREQFEKIAKRAGKHIDRLTKLSVDGTVVNGTYRSQSGISEWDFSVDFNDYGHITGKYWLSSENSDSSIPDHVADNISAMIKSYPEGFENDNLKHFKKKTYSREYKDYDNEDYDYIVSEGDSYEFEEHKEDKLNQQADIDNLKHPAELFRARKRQRVRSQIRKFIILLIVCTVLTGVLYGLYRYKEYQKGIEVGISSEEIIGEDYYQIKKSLEQAGFTHVHLQPVSDLKYEDIEDENTVISVEIKDTTSFAEEDMFPYDTNVVIRYHTLKEIPVPISAKQARKMNYKEIESLFKGAGFVYISEEQDRDLITGWISKDGAIESISIDGTTDFSENSCYRPDAKIVITYHTFDR